jgi:hypothetical protein
MVTEGRVSTTRNIQPGISALANRRRNRAGDTARGALVRASAGLLSALKRYERPPAMADARDDRGRVVAPAVASWMGSPAALCAELAG